MYTCILWLGAFKLFNNKTSYYNDESQCIDQGRVSWVVHVAFNDMLIFRDIFSMHSCWPYS